MKATKLLLTMLLFSTISYAKDLYRVVKVPSNDTLNVRIDAGIENPKIGELPYNATNIEVFECKDILNNNLWCRIQYQVGDATLRGWVDSRYLEPLDEYQEETQNELFEKAWSLYYEKGDKEKEAFKLFNKLSQQKNLLAKAQMAKMYYLGVGVTKDKNYARHLFSEVFNPLEKKAKSGDRYAQYLYAYYNDKGFGTSVDKKEAFKWYEKSANQGFSAAEVNLGYMYENAEVCVKDYQKAFDLYMHAVKQGNVIGQYNLAWMYREGKGVNKDYKKALFWYKKAFNNGLKSVLKDIEELEEKIEYGPIKERIENAKLYQNNCSIPSVPSIYASSSELRRHEKKVERFERCLSSVHDKNRKIFRELIEEVGGKEVDGGFNVFYQYTDSLKKLQARIEKIEASLNESADMYTTLVAKRKKEMDDTERWNSALQDLSNTLERMNRGEPYNYMGY